MVRMTNIILIIFTIFFWLAKDIVDAEKRTQTTDIFKLKTQGWKVVEKQNKIESRNGIKPYQNLKRVVQVVKYKLKKGENILYCILEYDSQLDKLIDFCDPDAKNFWIPN
tara:strand:+ start:722 stop:1051 length:330 start_codon:yes stop_codon:yes gene_type:complete